MRRHVLLRERTEVFLKAFPDFCYQPYGDAQDIAGIDDFPEFKNKFASHLPELLRSNKPEIYHIIDDHHDGLHRTVFDLRTVHRGMDGSKSRAYTTSAFLIKLKDAKLIPFSLSREGIANKALWGEDPDIDIDDDFVFSETFLLTGPDRDAVTELFNNTVVSFFRSHSAIFANGLLDVSAGAILFRYGRDLPPEEILPTLGIATELVSVLEQRMALMSQGAF